MNGGGGQKRAESTAVPSGAPAARRPRTTKAQELHDARTKQQIAQRHAAGGAFDAVPTFTGARTKAASARQPPRPAPLTPVHRYHFRQHTPPPARLRPGHSNSIAAAAAQPPPGPTAQLSALASRMRVAVPPEAIEQTGLMQAVVDKLQLLNEKLSGGIPVAAAVPAAESAATAAALEAAEATNQRLRRELEDVSDQLSATRRRLADAEFGAEAAQKAQRALEAERDELGARLAAKTEEAARVAAEMAALRTATADVDARLAASSARCAAQDATLAELRAQLAERDRTVAAMREKLVDDELLRRKLHNTIQDLKGNIRVFCRVRPPARGAPEAQQPPLYVLDAADARKLDVVETGTAATGRRQQTRHAFVYDHVFGPGATQEDVFEELAVFVQSVLDGYSCCVFAYGQTGSGKTYTMEGPSAPASSNSTSSSSSSSNGDKEEEEGVQQGAPERGVIPRTVELLFATMRDLEVRGWRYSLDVCFLEVYNEQLRDLLAARGPGGGAGAGAPLRIQHDASGRTSVAGCQTVPVESPEAVYALIRTARAARAVAATRYNDYSSRSHSVFQLHLHGRNEQRRETVESVLNLVDLAGSERLSATTPTGDSSSTSTSSGGSGSAAATSARQKETLNINLSLLNLRKVITALAAKQAHIPYRESVLTQLLQNALGGECKMLMFVNVSPEPANLSQSLSSLKFASTANKCVTGVVQRHAQKGVVASGAPSSKQR